ncbi:Hypothetical predicted protein [Olea europaea subsp. europaea]|uniref:Uncharacterized protein n=1 Tax=Olea europaea subsp. europaea TaxID=158383 RepID=A0A8S0RPP2_OLEEU|nr:Hypothetical predicted protein [Olea europaea subsp. europaea]
MLLRKFQEEIISFKAGRGQQNVEIYVTPDENSDGIGRIGVQLSPNVKLSKIKPKNITEVFSYSGREFWGLTSNVFNSLNQTFLDVSQSAIINLLPLPVLDEGSLALILIEAAPGGRKLPLELEQQIMSSGIMLVIVLGVFLPGVHQSFIMILGSDYYVN